jgi:hypothetical protein
VSWHVSLSGGWTPPPKCCPHLLPPPAHPTSPCAPSLHPPPAPLQAATHRFLDVAELKAPPPLHEALLDNALAAAHHFITGVEPLRIAAGAGAGTRDAPARVTDYVPPEGELGGLFDNAQRAKKAYAASGAAPAATPAATPAANPVSMVAEAATAAAAEAPAGAAAAAAAVAAVAAAGQQQQQQQQQAKPARRGWRRRRSSSSGDLADSGTIKAAKPAPSAAEPMAVEAPPRRRRGWRRLRPGPAAAV